MPMDEVRRLRCAIYTRKSTEEGLEQPFNSLHAQRRACEDYIRSQVGEGWIISAVQYDDGGYSGGDMRRPALQRLLADISAGSVDILVVYKVDRLTRALGDFAKLVEAFNRAGVSFVSVTQAFNTTTSMGRLTLNILLSFAQFEREITSERIRDKIAASKAQGMWMGGAVPLGYDGGVGVRRGVLSVNEVEARAVRLIFHKFLELGNTHTLQRWLAEEGIRSKRRITTSGRLAGGYAFSRGALRYLLQNRIYLGEIRHKEMVYPGRHPAIIHRSTFDAVQGMLEDISRRRRDRVTLGRRTLLNGLVFDTDGAAMRPAFSRSKKRRYSYYASTSAPGHGSNDLDGAIRRIPTVIVDALVTSWVAKLAMPPPGEAVGARKVRSIVARVEIHSARVVLVIRAAGVARAGKRRPALDIVRDLVSPGEEVRSDPSDLNLLRIALPVRLVARGGRKWQVLPKGHSGEIVGQPDPKLVRDLRAGHVVLRGCHVELDGFDRTLLRKTRAPNSSRDRRLARLAFLAPDIQRAILTGEPITYPAGEIPLSWQDQRRLLGLASGVTGPEAAS